MVLANSNVTANGDKTSSTLAFKVLRTTPSGAVTRFGVDGEFVSI